MDFILRPWLESDAKDLTIHLNNKRYGITVGTDYLFHIQKQLLTLSLNMLRNKWNKMNFVSK